MCPGALADRIGPGVPRHGFRIAAMLVSLRPAVPVTGQSPRAVESVWHRPGCLDLDPHLAGFQRSHRHLLDAEHRPEVVQDRGSSAARKVDVLVADSAARPLASAT
jgi:hypothetical protein